MGQRAVGHSVSPSRDVTAESFSIDAASIVAVAFGLATFVLHFATAGGYGYQRDELYFISCAHHLAWGYVDQPPLIAVITKLALFLFGDSLHGLRLLPAVAATATVLVTGRLAHRLGGGVFAQALAMLGIALAPFYLAVGNLLTMNAFEPLLWIGAAYLFVLAAEKNRPLLWAALGVVCGLGLLNKYSMFFYLGACILAIALTPSRRALLRPGFWLAIAIALTLVAPSLAWQAQHGWPQITVLRNAGADKNVTDSPLVFYVQQILMMNPLAAPIWLAGLYALFFGRANAPLRWYAFAYVILSATYLTLGAKVYYLAPIYPVLFAAGAAFIEGGLVRVRPLAAAYPVLLLAAGFAIAPEAFPLLPLPKFLVYQHVLDLRGIKMERHPEGLVPQQFADQMGWDTLVKTVATVYDGLPAAQQRDAAILTRDYGQAAAIDFLGPRFGLPQAISGHNNYYLYGTRGASGRVVISVGLPKAQLATEFRTVRLAATYRDAYLLPDFNNLPVYVCTGPIESFAAWWPATKHYI